MTVFERIENLRKSNKISQGKLEKELGFSNGSISKWKTSMPNPERLQKIANYFGVSLEYLLNGEEKEASRPNTLAAHFDGEEYTEEEMDEIKKFAEYVKSRRKS